ncbi:MAG: alginate export family protein [Candidatus Hydrogenedentes bacterium]|nr:alginate export family protein [Candidatus Hydrogenedentota bacterium]
MRFKTLLAVALIASLGSVAFAELQNVEIGGSIRIRGNYFDMDGMGDSSFIEQRTRLNIKADFTQDVFAFIEIDSYDVWGEDFRSLYLTGADVRGRDNVDLYQAYIEARNLWGSPLSVRVGRQEIALGNQFLVGVKDVSSIFPGLSFDALRLTFENEAVKIDAIAAKLAETYGDFGDDDVDFYALYGSYLGIEDITLDAYWMFVRDDQGVLANVINGTTVDIHTIGLRGAGVIGGFDFELEAAYQFGDVDDVPSACPFGFGHADVDYDEFAVNAELGYTFDTSWQPRVFARFAYFGGGKPDRRCWSNDYDMPFNRLFSNVEYSEFIDQTALSNVLVYTLGVQAMVTETLELKLLGSYFQQDQNYYRGKDNLGWELGLYADYQYSEDLVIRAGFAHFFAKSGMDAARIADNGLNFFPGNKRDDYNYLFLETEIAF